MMPEYQPNQYQYYPVPKAPKYYTLLSNIMTYNIHVTEEEKQQQIKESFHFATHVITLIFSKHYQRNNQKGNRYR